MTLAAFDFALRAATVALLLVLAASLYRDFRKVVAGRLAVAFALGSAVHAAISGIGSVSGVPLSHAPLIALSTGNVVVFWLFCRALFDDAFSLRWWHALIWLAVAAFSFANCLWIAPAGHVRLSIFAINLVALGFIVLAVAQTVASWSGDLVEGRRRLRILIITAAALFGGINALLQILVSGGDAGQRRRDFVRDGARRRCRPVFGRSHRARGSRSAGCRAGFRCCGPKTGRRADAADGG